MRRRTLIGWAVVVMVLGFGVYLRLWYIESEFSHQDRELIRTQFDLANKEAMDESAEWRFKFDLEVKRANECAHELSEVKEALEKKIQEVAIINRNLSMLHKENFGLVKRVESISQELQMERLKCRV